MSTLSYSERYPYTEPANPPYDNGETIKAGDPIRITRGGGLLGGFTAEGVAEYGTGAKSEVMYLRQDRCSTWGQRDTLYTAHLHINHGDSALVKLDYVPVHSSLGATPYTYAP